jgi:hypothetical protein
VQQQTNKQTNEQTNEQTNKHPQAQGNATAAFADHRHEERPTEKTKTT